MFANGREPMTDIPVHSPFDHFGSRAQLYPLPWVPAEPLVKKFGSHASADVQCPERGQGTTTLLKIGSRTSSRCNQRTYVPFYGKKHLSGENPRRPGRYRLFDECDCTRYGSRLPYRQPNDSPSRIQLYSRGIVDSNSPSKLSSVQFLQLMILHRCVLVSFVTSALRVQKKWRE